MHFPHSSLLLSERVRKMLDITEGGAYMLLFAKPEYVEFMLPFTYIDYPDNMEAGIIDIEAYGEIFGEIKYCYCSYSLTDRRMYENGDFEQLTELLKNPRGRLVKVVVKVKKGSPKDGKIDTESIVQAYNDERFRALELGSWGFNDKSFHDSTKDNI